MHDAQGLHGAQRHPWQWYHNPELLESRCHNPPTPSASCLCLSSDTGGSFWRQDGAITRDHGFPKEKGSSPCPVGRMLTASQAAGSCLKRELVSSTETRFL